MKEVREPVMCMAGLRVFQEGGTACEKTMRGVLGSGTTKRLNVFPSHVRHLEALFIVGYPSIS